MPHLVIQTPDGNETEFILDEKPLIIGRDENCTLHFPSGQVSRQHARIDFANGDYWVSDLGSANGTVINGNKIQEATPLKHNNVIDISGFHVIYKTNTEATQMTFALVGQGDPVDNQTFILPIGKLQVGRAEDNAIVLDDNSLSRNHALITVTLKGVHVEDLRSSNGTFINDNRIHNQILKSADKVRFGNVEFLVSQIGQRGSQKSLGQLLNRLNNAERSVKVALGIAALSGVLLLGTISAALHHTIQTRPTTKKSAPSLQATYEAAINRYLVQARNLMQKENWQAAAEAFQHVISRDPIHKEARIGLQKAQDNLTHQVMIQAAKASLRKNNAADVLRKVKNIPTNAYYSFEAQNLHRAAVQAILDASLDAAIRSCATRDWKKCHQLAVRILTHLPKHQQALELTEEAEKQMKRSRIAHNPWTSPQP